MESLDSSSGNNAERNSTPSLFSGNILIVDDDPVGLKHLARTLKKEGASITMASSGRDALKIIRHHSFDLILSDLVMEEVDGIDLLTYVKKNSPETEVVILTGYATVATAIEAIKKGAYHYLQKPFRLEELRSVAGNALEKVRLRKEVHRLTLEKVKGQGVEQIIGRSPNIMKLKKIIPQVSRTDSNILITGESGTGKELVARAIHQESSRAHKRFVAINCGSFSEDLLANELFGHEKEAYTGAMSAQTGLLENADGGTLFLDEVGDMPLAMQIKLLRVIQEREFMRVGGVKPISINVRIIGATNKDLKKGIETGQFRQDLFYRLNVVSLHLPALSERKEDVPLLVNHFLKKILSRSNRNLVGFSPEAMGYLKKYSYPGNVRELENIIERCAVLATGDQLGPEDLPNDIKEMEVFSFHREAASYRSLEELERDYINWIMEEVGRNKSKAARILGIDRVSLYRKLKKYQIVED